MIFCIITHVNHHQDQQHYFAYVFYVREMNIWLKYVDNVIIVAPLEQLEKTAIDKAYTDAAIQFRAVPSFNLTGLKSLLRAVFLLPKLFSTVYKAMQAADHIHLRCPGNMGLIGCIVQVFFPKKKKTAKYAGNWDLKAKQPWSYRLQKWIVNNTFLTKNMQVLVYGAWEGSSVNIKPFFTATYSEKEAAPVLPRSVNAVIRFIFVGMLAEGKRPLYAVKLVERLIQSGVNASLQLYGEGADRVLLESYIATHHLEKFIQLEGNQPKEIVQEAYKKAHFLVLASKSEGWPKVVAEAMFWGCVPVATAVSCVENMLDSGNRGILLSMDLDADVQNILLLLNSPEAYQEKSDKALSWSQDYTIEKFESEIKKLL